MAIKEPKTSISLNTLCHEYIRHLSLITTKLGKDYKYYSPHFQSEMLGLYDYKQKNDLELLKLKEIILKHLEFYNSSNNFKCLLNVDICKLISSVYYYSFGVLLDSNKAEMLRNSNIWEKKAFRLSIYSSPLLSVHNSSLQKVYARHGDMYNLEFGEWSERNKIINSESKKIEMLDVVIQEIEYWKNLTNFWLFLKPKLGKDKRDTSVVSILENTDLSMIICSFLIKKENSFQEINFQQCYSLSIQLFTGFLKSNEYFEDDQLALLVRNLGDLKLRESFPCSWRNNRQELLYLGRQTGKHGTGLVYTKILAEIELVNSGQL